MTNALEIEVFDLVAVFLLEAFHGGDWVFLFLEHAKQEVEIGNKGAGASGPLVGSVARVVDEEDGASEPGADLSAEGAQVGGGFFALVLVPGESLGKGIHNHHSGFDAEV